MPSKVTRVGFNADGTHGAARRLPEVLCEVRLDARAPILERLVELAYLHPKVAASVQVNVLAAWRREQPRGVTCRRGVRETV